MGDKPTNEDSEKKLQLYDTLRNYRTDNLQDRRVTTSLPIL